MRFTNLILILLLGSTIASGGTIVGNGMIPLPSASITLEFNPTWNAQGGEFIHIHNKNILENDLLSTDVQVFSSPRDSRGILESGVVHDTSRVGGNLWVPVSDFFGFQGYRMERIQNVVSHQIRIVKYALENLCKANQVLFVTITQPVTGEKEPDIRQSIRSLGCSKDE